jgi:hypothetical protein
METKPGTKTTEFWSMIAVVVLPWLATLGDNTDVVNLVPERYRYLLPVVAGLSNALVVGLYGVGRGKAKSGVPYNPTA